MTDVELARLAAGWAHLLRLLERLRREREGEPLVRIEP